MRPVKVTMNAAGFSPWVPIAYNESWFGVGVAVILSEDASLTYTVQHSFDDPILQYDPTNAVTIARSGTTATVTDNGPLGIGHGLSTGDSVIIQSSGSTALDSPGPVLTDGITGIARGTVGWNVASTPTNKTYTYLVANSGPTTDGGNAHVARWRVFASTLASQTARGTVTYNYPVRAIRLYISAYSAGFADMIVLQGVSP
jgi:hypothetical protein